MKSGTFIRVAVLSPFIALLLPVPGRAQLSLAVKQIYESAAVVPTNIDGVTTYRSPPRGFDAVHAADTELALYGFPPRPDPQADPSAYGEWAKAMSSLGQPATGPLEDMHIASRNLMPAGPPVAGPAGTPFSLPTTNWSGIMNTVPGLTAWNSEKSFYWVQSEFTVPVAEQAFATGGGYVCDGGWDAEVSWNGIDGLGPANDVLQGGSYSAAYCNNGMRKTRYYAWAEWFPSYYILREFDVNPGDDMFVATYDGSATSGLVLVADLTQGVYKIVNLKLKVGSHLVGNSAEYIVERPCICNKSVYQGNLFPLANYVKNFWAGSFAYTFERADPARPPNEFPGSNSPSTYLITMTTSSTTEDISTAIAAGKYGLFFADENCAFSGGCAKP